MSVQQTIPLGQASWRFSARWLARRHDCTLQGILARCQGGCCTAGKSGTYWPGRSGPGGRCVHLGPQGCRLSATVRPVTCLLYPLVLNKNGTVVLHHRTVSEQSICCGNHGQGPRLVDALAEGLVALIGWEQYECLRQCVDDGVDFDAAVPTPIRDALRLEEEWAATNTPPQPRAPVVRAAEVE